MGRRGRTSVSDNHRCEDVTCPKCSGLPEEDRERRIAYRWARAAFNLGYLDGHQTGDAALLKQAIIERWDGTAYVGDRDEIICEAIRQAIKEISGA